MRGSKKWICALGMGGLLWSFAQGVAAEEVTHLTLKLTQIEQIQGAEAGNSELYMVVTDFPKKSMPAYYRVPEYPAHWLSRYLKGVKKVTLWDQKFEKCESRDLLVSLVEEDVPPWNLDDLLGTVKLKLICEKGKMTTQWDIPKKETTQLVKGKENTFAIKGKDFEYHLTFHLEKKNEVKSKDGTVK